MFIFFNLSLPPPPFRQPCRFLSGFERNIKGTKENDERYWNCSHSNRRQFFTFLSVVFHRYRVGLSTGEFNNEQKASTDHGKFAVRSFAWSPCPVRRHAPAIPTENSCVPQKESVAGPAFFLRVGSRRSMHARVSFKYLPTKYTHTYTYTARSSVEARRKLANRDDRKYDRTGDRFLTTFDDWICRSWFSANVGRTRLYRCETRVSVLGGFLFRYCFFDERVNRERDKWRVQFLLSFFKSIVALKKHITGRERAKIGKSPWYSRLTKIMLSTILSGKREIENIPCEKLRV